MAVAERALEADLAMSEDPRRRVAVLERHVGRTYLLWFREQTEFAFGRIPIADLQSRTAYPLQDAIVRLHEARRQLAQPDTLPQPSAPKFSKTFGPGLVTNEHPGNSPSERERQSLLGERARIARADVKARFEAFQAGTITGTLESLIDALRRLSESEVATNPVPSHCVAAYEDAFKLAREVEGITAQRHKQGRVPQFDLDLARYHRLSMQIKLLESKKQVEAVPKKGK
jgi:hypothetical protein